MAIESGFRYYESVWLQVCQVDGVMRFSLMLVISIFVACAESGQAVAQRIGPSIGETRFSDVLSIDVECLPRLTESKVDVYYDQETGDVYANIGAGVALFGIWGEAIINENLDSSTLGEAADSLPLPIQSDDAGIGFLDVDGLIDQIEEDDGTLTTGAGGGPYNLGALLPRGLFPSDFAALGTDAEGLDSVYVSYGLTVGGVFNDGFQILQQPNLAQAGSTCSVPEPSAFGLFVICTVGLQVCRRR